MPAHPHSGDPPDVVIMAAAGGRLGNHLRQQMKVTPSREGGMQELVATVNEFDAIPGQDKAKKIKGIGPGNAPAGFPDGTANIAAARNCWYSGGSAINLLMQGLITPVKPGGCLFLACTTSQLLHLATALVWAIESGYIEGASLSMTKLVPDDDAGSGSLSFGFRCSTTLPGAAPPLVRTAAEALLLDRRPAAESLLPSPSTAGQEQKPTYSSFGTIFASWSCPRRNQLALLFTGK